MTVYIPESWVRPTHAQQHALTIEAYRIEGVTSPNRGQIELAQAMMGHESVYACPDRPIVWVGSNNKGAIQCVRKPKVRGVCPDSRIASEPWCGNACFSSIDTHPNADGSSTPYGVCFAADADHLLGTRRVIRLLKRYPAVMQAMTTGAPSAFSAALYAIHYYEGFGKTPSERIANHCASITRWLGVLRAGLDGSHDEYPDPEGDAIRAIVEGRQIPAWRLLDEAEESMEDERDQSVSETPDGT